MTDPSVVTVIAEQLELLTKSFQLLLGRVDRLEQDVDSTLPSWVKGETFQERVRNLIKERKEALNANVENERLRAVVSDLEARLAAVTADFVAICGALPTWCGEGSIAQRVARVVEVADSASCQLQALSRTARVS